MRNRRVFCREHAFYSCGRRRNRFVFSFSAVILYLFILYLLLTTLFMNDATTSINFHEGARGQWRAANRRSWPAVRGFEPATFMSNRLELICSATADVKFSLRAIFMVDLPYLGQTWTIQIPSIFPEAVYLEWRYFGQVESYWTLYCLPFLCENWLHVYFHFLVNGAAVPPGHSNNMYPCNVQENSRFHL